MDPLHRPMVLMSYRELLAAINRDFEVRDDARLDGPVVMAVLDARGVVHFGHLVAFSIGTVPVGDSTASASTPVPGDVYTSAPRVDSVTEDDDAPTRVVDVCDDLDPIPVRIPDLIPDFDSDPGDFRAASDRTCILDIRSMPGAHAWATEDPGEEHTVYAGHPMGDRFDEETTTIRGRTPSVARLARPARPTPRDTVVSTAIGPERRPHHVRLVSRSRR